MDINRSMMAPVAPSLTNSSCDSWHHNSSGSHEITPSKLVVLDCNTTGSAKLRGRRETLSNSMRSSGFESVLLEKQQRIGIYRASLTIPFEGLGLSTSLNVKNGIRLALVAWDVWDGGGRCEGEKRSLMVEVRLGGVEEEERLLNSHDNGGGATTKIIKGNPHILQGRYSSSPLLILLHANLCVMDPVLVEEATLELFGGKILLRVPYHNKICEFDSFWDDDTKYGMQHGGCGTVEFVEQLMCRFCGNRFLSTSSTHTSSPLRVFQLPSGHFDDIVDDMICFEGPVAVPMTAREVTFARKGRLLMGDSFCLLHSSDMCVGTIDTTVVNVADGVYDDQSERVDDREYDIGPIKNMARCARCNYWLGDVILCQEGSSGDESSATEICVDGYCGFHLRLHRILGEEPPSVGKRSELADHIKSPPSLLLFEDYQARHWLLHKVRKAAFVDRCYAFLLAVRDWGQGNSKSVWRDRAISLRVINAESLISISEDLLPTRAVSVQFSIVESSETGRKSTQRIWVRPDEFNDILEGLNEISGFITQINPSIGSAVDGRSPTKWLSFLL